MAKETERKFLVAGEGWRDQVTACMYIVQGYLVLRDNLEIRVRITGNEKANLTIKSANAELSRDEFEYSIPLSDAKVLIEKHQGLLIKKSRYVVPRQEGRHWEIDVFEGDHDGLCIAEVELEENTKGCCEFSRPDWLGREVTGETRYYNASLSQDSGNVHS